jgi:hypothetical protein
MSTISDTYVPANAGNPSGRQLWCPHCRTDQHLTIDSIELLCPPQPDLVSVAYTCVGCAASHMHTANVCHVAAVLSRSRTDADVLHFGDEYIHCGVPMQVTVPRFRSSTTVSSANPAEALLDVYLQTQVLHCACGFQMEIPR